MFTAAETQILDIVVADGDTLKLPSAAISRRLYQSGQNFTPVKASKAAINGYIDRVNPARQSRRRLPYV